MSCVVRRAELSDVEGIAGLVSAYWQFESIDGFDRHRITSLLSELIATPERGSCWIAEVDAVPVAYLLCVYTFSLEHGGMMAEVDELFVDPHRRSAGLGTALLRAAERGMAETGIVRIQLQLDPENARARAFYARHGYQLRGYALMDKSG